MLDNATLRGVKCDDKVVALVAFRTQEVDGVVVAWVPLLGVLPNDATTNWGVPKDCADGKPWGGRGLGSFLMHLVKEAVKQEANGRSVRVELQCIQAEDSPCKFYDKHGFRPSAQETPSMPGVDLKPGHVLLEWTPDATPTVRGLQRPRSPLYCRGKSS